MFVSYPNAPNRESSGSSICTKVYEVPPIYIRFWITLSCFHIKFCCNGKLLSNFTDVDFDYIYFLDYAGKKKRL